MELEIKKKSRRKLQTLTGFISFIIGLQALAVLNIGLLIETMDIPDLFLFQLPFLGVFLGVVGLFTMNRSKQFAWWGIGINLFIPIFIGLMFGLSWTINAKP
ncbi:hypothetical protein ABE65_010565 [Fictibacillus phosphorivorans]|uniref:DUF4064 domain-containing protein n=1 Tax=Fictibacillus phosphorivorans TaxID=1221500 RepID=A0A160IM34_9BACL|nr:hypothetical protein [Fictibacillus phosphorivorans]ANC77221.1 hypothetical protein ABE65_010565 [Fictibacillus phosphorivorans]